MSETVAAIIPNWNRADLLASALLSLAAQDYPAAETVVVDDGSTDESVAVARRAGATVIQSPTRVGFARSINRGLRHVSSDWILVLNNDVELSPSWIRTALAAALNESRAAFVVGKTFNFSDRTVIDGTFDLVCRGGLAWRAGHGAPDSTLWNDHRFVTGAPFTALLCRRWVFDRIGGLDERFGSYMEDVDWSLRCAAAGISGLYVPEAVAYHRGSATLGLWSNATVRLLSRNQVLIYIKHLRGANLLAAVVAQLLWLGLAASRAKGLAAVWGKIDALRQLRSWRREPSSWPLVSEAVLASERELFELQQRCGFDSLWRWYFRLMGDPCTRPPR